VSEAPWAHRRLHFVGIGGAGMSGLAIVARALGAEVSGSDAAESAYLERVRGAGVEPIIGHDRANLPEGDDVEVVYSTAVSPDNPERAAAHERGLRERHRGDLLGEVSALKRCIAVTGTHGKTTTAAMLHRILLGAGLQPSYLVGAELRETGTNAEWAEGEWLVVEADESDRSLLHLQPEIAVLTNLELDHHTTYASLLDLEATMREFLARAGEAVVWDRPELLALRAGSVPFDAPEPRLTPEGSRFTWEGIEVWVPVPGSHNALNAAAALEAAALAGVPPDDARAALAEFRPAGRRFERVGETDSGAEVYDE
jgi:UDP-N-acetylmuramate--alanine ligase